MNTALLLLWPVVLASIPATEYPPIFKRGQDKYRTYYSDQENVKVTRKCFAKGNPEPEVEWFKKIGDKYIHLIHVQGKTRVKVRKTLTFHALRYSDEGWYRCVASNKHGNITWDFYQDVTVNEFAGEIPPQIVNNEENITVYENEEAELKCTFFVSEPPGVYWHKLYTVNGTEYEEAIDLIDFDHPEVIRFPRANVTDSAVYKCVVVNRYGQSSLKHTLTVLPLPSSLGGHHASGGAISRCNCLLLLLVLRCLITRHSNIWNMGVDFW